MHKLSPLEEEIIYYNEEYREGNPSISDQEYDFLIEKLRNENPDSSLLKVSVIEKVKSESRKEKLPITMASLEKDKSVEEYLKYLKANDIPEDTELIISPKLDGISLVVDERPNKKAWTRGDGEVGQESTMHFNQMNRIDHADLRYVYTYGEAILSKSNWEKYFLGKLSPYTGKPYKSARNVVGGLLNTDEPREELKHVDYIRYGLSSDRNKDEMLQVCNTLNAVPFKFKRVLAKDINEELLNNLYNEWSEFYKIDGLVIDINDKFIRNNVGRERNNNPKYARAIKLPMWGENAIVKVLGITWQVSKQGDLKPVINIEPTNIGGATISNVTGYNAKYLFENNIAVDSIIEITRSGDVIPKHLKTISFDFNENYNQKIYLKCPCCENSLTWDETHTELCCTNPTCDDMLIGKLVHFFKTMEIEEFGEPTIIKMYYNGYKTPNDILKMNFNNICSVEGFATKSANNLLKEFNKLKENGVSLAKLIHATDVMSGRLGSKTIQLIIDETGEDNLYNLTEVDLRQIKGIAEITANIFINGMKEFSKPEYQELFNYINIIKMEKTEVTGSKFAGYKLCFTGVRPNKEQEAYICSEGGEVVSGVSKNTTHLVVKDLSDKTLKSEKSVKAFSLGIKILTIEELLQ